MHPQPYFGRKDLRPVKMSSGVVAGPVFLLGVRLKHVSASINSSASNSEGKEYHRPPLHVHNNPHISLNMALVQAGSGKINLDAQRANQYVPEQDEVIFRRRSSNTRVDARARIIARDEVSKVEAALPLDGIRVS